MHAGEEDHARPGWTTSRAGQESPWKSQSEWQRTGINGESTSIVWPTLGSRTAKEENRYRCNVDWLRDGHTGKPCKNVWSDQCTDYVDLLCKMANHRNCVHSLLPPVKSCNHYLRPKGHIYMNCPDVTMRCIKSHLYHAVFISTRNVFFNPFYVRFYHCTACTVYFHWLNVRL